MEYKFLTSFLFLILAGCFGNPRYPKIEAFFTTLDMPQNTTATTEILRNKVFKIELVTSPSESEPQREIEVGLNVKNFLNTKKNIRIFLIKTLYNSETQRLTGVEIYYFEE